MIHQRALKDLYLMVLLRNNMKPYFKSLMSFFNTLLGIHAYFLSYIYICMPLLYTNLIT